MANTPVTLLRPKLDFVFKRLFGDANHLEHLTRLLQAALTLPLEEYEALTLLDPHLYRDRDDDKECVLDVLVKTRSGRKVNVEIQLLATPEMFERMQFYAAKLLSGQVKKGEEYENMPQVVCIAILDYRLIRENAIYHHRFRLCDPEAGVEYPESLEIHMLELPKLPAASDGTNLWNWMSFLKSEKPEEFEAVIKRGPDMAKAVWRLAELSADEEMQMLADAQAKAEWDQRGRIRYAEKEGIRKGMKEGLEKGKAEGKAEGEANIVRHMLQMHMTLPDIAELTGLSVEEIERIAKDAKA